MPPHMDAQPILAERHQHILNNLLNHYPCLFHLLGHVNAQI